MDHLYLRLRSSCLLRPRFISTHYSTCLAKQNQSGASAWYLAFILFSTTSLT